MKGKEVGRTKRDKINTKNDLFIVCCLKSYELHFLNVFSANEDDILRSVELLYYVC